MTVARQMTVHYGSTTIDGSGGVHLHGEPPIRWVEKWDSGQVDFTLLVQADTAGALITAVQGVIDAFRAPRQDLLIKRGGTNELDRSFSTNKAFNHDPSVTKVGSPEDNGRMQLLAVSIKYGLPADKASLNGRRDSTISTAYDASGRRTVTIKGVYTAIGDDTQASAQYAAEIAAYATAVLTAIDDDAAFELVPHDNEHHETDQELQFTRVYRELLWPQLGDPDDDDVVFDDPDLAEQELGITVRRSAPGDSEGLFGLIDPVLRMADVTVTYRAAVPAGPTQLAAVRDRVLIYLAQRVAVAVPEGVGRALVQSDVHLDYDDSRIDITQRWECALQGGWAQRAHTESVEYDEGNVVIPKWSKTRWARYVHTSPETCTITVREQGVFVGPYARLAIPRKITPLTPPPPGAKWLHLKTMSSPTEQIRGLDGETLVVFLLDRTSIWEAVAAAPPVVITPD